MKSLIWMIALIVAITNTGCFQGNPPPQMNPAAVPVVTAEEAEKLNEEAKTIALAEKEKREPFYRFYQDTKLDSICFQGTIRAISTIPDPAKNDYDNCLYALFVEIDALLSDATTDAEIPCEVIVNVPIMKNKSILQDNKFLSGDKVWCTCVQYDTMPQAIQEIQLSDNIQSFEHQQYYSIGINKISSFRKDGNRNFAKREITILPIQTLPKDKEAASFRKERIQNEIARIEEEIKKHGGSFEKWKEEYKPIAEKYKQLSSEGYKGWINDSFFAAGGNETTYKTKEYIEGIMPYKEYLQKNNIDLIVVRIPSKWDFAARVLASDVFQENPAWVEHYYKCLKNDIEIIDPMQEMYKHRYDYPLFYYYNVEKETHPHEGTFFCTAIVLSNVLERYRFIKSNEQISLVAAEHKKNAPDFFYPEGNPKYDSLSHIAFHRVVIGDDTIHLLRCSNSPFLFVSNSFLGSKAMEPDLGIPQFVSYLLQSVPDWYYQSGMGNQMLRNLISDSTVLNSRKAVIMGAHPNNWKGFPPIPKYISDNAQKLTLEKSLNFESDDIQIIQNDSFVIKQDSTSSFTIKRKSDSNASDVSFIISFDIPFVKGKETCMVRIPLNKACVSNWYISDSATKQLIDTYSTSVGIFDTDTNDNVDLFIPMSETNRSVVLKAELTSNVYDFRNIELWYY